MTPISFTAWRKRLGLSVRAAALALGCDKDAASRYSNGNARIPRYIALACAAIEAGIDPEK